MSRYLDLEAVGRRMHTRRIEIGYSVEELSKASKVSPATIRNYEGAQRDMGICRLFAIATALHVSLDWLCGRVNAVFPVVALGKPSAPKENDGADAKGTLTI